MVARESVADSSPEWIEVEAIRVDKEVRVVIASKSDVVWLELSDVEVRH